MGNLMAGESGPAPIFFTPKGEWIAIGTEEARPGACVRNFVSSTIPALSNDDLRIETFQLLRAARRLMRLALEGDGPNEV